MLQRKTQSSDTQSFKEVLGDFKMSTACWRTERLENLRQYIEMYLAVFGHFNISFVN